MGSTFAIMKIQIKNLSKTFSLPGGRLLPVLKDISLEVEQGDFVIILGESGCGKSTLLRILAGMMPPCSGTIQVDDRKVVGPDASISMLFQQPSLLPWLNVHENIAFGCEIRGETDNLEDRVSKFIEMVGLSGFEKCHPTELSLGMAYRACLARALLGHPEVFLLDEPFGALDTFTRNRLREEFTNIWLSERFTAVFVTHDIDEAVLMGNKVVLFGGRPCRIWEVIDVDLKYPRKMTDDSVFHTRKRILERLGTTITGNTVV